MTQAHNKKTCEKLTETLLDLASIPVYIGIILTNWIFQKLSNKK